METLQAGIEGLLTKRLTLLVLSHRFHRHLGQDHDLLLTVKLTLLLRAHFGVFQMLAGNGPMTMMVPSHLPQQTILSFERTCAFLLLFLAQEHWWEARCQEENTSSQPKRHPMCDHAPKSRCLTFPIYILSKACEGQAFVSLKDGEADLMRLSGSTLAVQSHSHVCWASVRILGPG